LPKDGRIAIVPTIESSRRDVTKIEAWCMPNEKDRRFADDETFVPSK